MCFVVNKALVKPSPEMVVKEKILSEGIAETFEEVVLQSEIQSSSMAADCEVTIAEMDSEGAAHKISRKSYEKAHIDVDVKHTEEKQDTCMTVALHQIETVFRSTRRASKEENVFAEAILSTSYCADSAIATVAHLFEKSKLLSKSVLSVPCGKRKLRTMKEDAIRAISDVDEKISATVVVEREFMAGSAEMLVAPNRIEACALRVAELRRRVPGILGEAELMYLPEEPQSEDSAFLNVEENSSVLLSVKPVFEISASITECVLPAKLTIPVQAKRGRSPTGVVVDLEIEAGEEIANTEALVDVTASSCEEVSLDVTEFTSDVLDVDVSMEAVMEEEDIEAVGPTFYTQLIDLAIQMPTAVAAVSRLIEEAKMRVLEADAEIKLALSTRAEMQQLHLKLAAAEREFIDKNTDLDAVFESRGELESTLWEINERNQTSVSETILRKTDKPSREADRKKDLKKKPVDEKKRSAEKIQQLEEERSSEQEEITEAVFHLEHVDEFIRTSRIIKDCLRHEISLVAKQASTHSVQKKQKRVAQGPKEELDVSEEVVEMLDEGIIAEASFDMQLHEKGAGTTEDIEDTVQAKIPLAPKEKEEQVTRVEEKKSKKKTKKTKLKEAAPKEIVDELDQELIEEASFSVQVQRRSVGGAEGFENTVQAKIALPTKEQEKQAVPDEEKEPKEVEKSKGERDILGVSRENVEDAYSYAQQSGESVEETEAVTENAGTLKSYEKLEGQMEGNKHEVVTTEAPEISAQEITQKKKKNIPRALFIPAEINSRFGDKSILFSETSITTQVTSREASAEIEAITSPRKPQSATISMKIDSAKRSISRGRTPSSATEFTFTQRTTSNRGDSESFEATVRKPKDRSGLPPLPREKVQGETIITREESAEDAEISCRRPSESEFVELLVRAPSEREMGLEIEAIAPLEIDFAESKAATEEVKLAVSLISPGQLLTAEVVSKMREHALSEIFCKSVRRKRLSKTLEKPKMPVSSTADKRSVEEGIPPTEASFPSEAPQQHPWKKSSANLIEESEVSAKYSRKESDEISCILIMLPAKEAAMCSTSEPVLRKRMKKRQSAGTEVLASETKEIGAEEAKKRSTVVGREEPRKKRAEEMLEETEIFPEFEGDLSAATTEFSLRESASEADSISVREVILKKLRKKRASVAEEELDVSEDDHKLKSKKNASAETSKEEEQLSKEKRKDTAKKISGTPEDSGIVVISLAEDDNKMTLKDAATPLVAADVEKEEEISEEGNLIEQDVKEQYEELECSAQFTVGAKTGEDIVVTDAEAAFAILLKTKDDETLADDISELTEYTISGSALSRRSSALSSDESCAVAQRQRRRREGFVSLPDKEFQGHRGDTARVECELFNEEDEVTWLINGNPISNDSRCAEESDGYMRTLVMTDLRPQDSGTVISIRVGDHFGETVLIVEETAAEIVEGLPQRLIGTVDDDVTLFVKLSHEAKNVNWFFKGQPIEGSDSMVMKTEKDVAFLTIKSVDFNRMGRYSVSADGTETSTMLEVRGKPVLDVDHLTELIEIESQQNLSFTIPFKANPEPKVECFFNGEPVPREQRIQVEIFNDEVIVSKRKVVRKDAGEYIVKVANEFGELSQNFTLVVKDTPETPERVRVTEVGPDFIAITWEAPSNDGGSEITGYVVEKKEAGRRTFHAVAQISASRTDHVIEGLESNTNYEIRLSAINKYGSGEYSGPIAVCTGTPFMRPVVVQAPAITCINSEGCTLQWIEVQEDGGSPIYGYDVFIRKDRGDWVKLNDEVVFVRRYNVTGLEAGPLYEFKVEAYNEAGLQSNSDVVSETLTLSATYGRPSKQLSLPRILITGPDSVSVEWNEPEFDEENVTSYTIRYRSEGSSVWSQTESEHSPHSIVGLKEGVAYIFKIAPVNAVGLGEFSEETQPIRVIVESEPEITKGIKNVSVPCKRGLRLECHAMGEPSPQYIWYKDGEEIIPADENVEIINEGYMSALVIEKTAFTDEGEYTCEVVNKLGSKKSNAKVTITEVRAHFEASFAEFTEIMEGQDITLRCELSDEDASVVWYRNGKKVTPNERIAISVDGTQRKLTIINAAPKDSGDYECATIDDRSKARGELLVKEEEPHIKEGPQDQTVNKFGERVILTCTATKPIKQVVRWYKNGVEVWPQRHKMAMTVIDNTAFLEIENFDVHDIGEYYVMLSEDERSAPAALELKVAPDIQLAENFEKEIVLNADEDLNVSFTFTAYPTPKVEFTHNGEHLDEQRTRMEIYDDSAFIRIRNMKRSDSGAVKITVLNENGKATKDIHVSVVDIPSEPRSLAATNISTDSALLEWLPPLENNGSPLTGYIIERKMAETGRWRNVATVKADKESFLMEELFPDEIYVFRVCAINEVGKGPPSVAVDVITKKEAEAVQEKVPQTLADAVLLDTPGKPLIALIEKNKVQISWESIISADSYDVERSSLTEPMWLTIANTDHITFIDRSIVENDDYIYRVVAKSDKRASCPSEPSEPISIKRPEAVEEEQLEGEKPDEKKTRKTGTEVKAVEEEAAGEEFMSGQREIAQAEETTPDFGAVVRPPMEQMQVKNGKMESEAVTGIEVLEGTIKKELEESKSEKKKKLEEKALKALEESTVEMPAVGQQEATFDGTKAFEDQTSISGVVNEVKPGELGKEIEAELGMMEEKPKKLSEEKPEKKKMKKKIKEELAKREEKADEDKAEETMKHEEKSQVQEVNSNALLASEGISTKGKSPKTVEAGAAEENLEEAPKDERRPKEKEEAVHAEEAKGKSEKKSERKAPKLKVTAEETNLKLTLHSKAELKVRIEGNFETCRWTKDKKPLPEQSTTTTETESTLFIDSVSESSSGTYICAAVNKTTKSSVEFDVKVVEKPEVEFDTKTLEAKVGETLKISASVTGLPQPKISWYKNGIPVGAADGVVLAHRSGVASITLKKCMIDDCGIYLISVENEVGKSESEVTVKVKGVPSAPLGPLSVTNISATSCSLSWQPPTSDGNSKLLGYCIEKRDIKRPAWAFHARTADTFAEIKGLVEMTKYHFRVTAENALGNGPPIETEQPVELMEPIGGPKSAPPKPIVKETTNNSITVQWTPVVDSGDILYNVEMRESKSKRAWALVNKQPIGETEVTAANLKAGSIYEFRVVAVSAVGSGPPSEPSDAIECTERKEVHKPVFTKTPEEVICTEQKKIKITTEFIGEPAPQVVWFKNSNEIFTRKRQWIETSKTASILTIGEVREDDEGEYKILLRNESGSAEHVFKVTVDRPPQITRPEKYADAQLYNQNEEVNLRLTFSGRPTPTAEWIDSRGGAISTRSSRYKVTTAENHSTLTIYGLKADDSGSYSLRVKNRAGEDRCDIPIQVTDRPVPPGRPVVQDQNVDSVRLLWATSMQDGGSAVRNYTVEMRKESEDVWSFAEITKQPFTTLFNLQAGQIYRFRVRADNAYGTSEPSEESESVFVPDMSRSVAEPQPEDKTSAEEVPCRIDYDHLATDIKPSEYRTIDVNRLPNDLEAKYIICEELGRGAYGTVYRAVEKATGKTWAAKMVQVRPGVKKEVVVHEINIMNQLHHEKLLALHEAFDLGSQMCLIEEIVSGGELLDRILEDDELMSEEEVRDYIRQILHGVQHMHKSNIVHLDLKPENILLRSKDSTEVKIIDFGLARKLDAKKTVKLLFGTPEFCAPEVVNFEPVGFGADMWAIGVITYLLLSGLSPFLGNSDEETLANVSAGDWDFDDPSWEEVSPVAKDFICRLLVKDRRRRLTPSEALSHPWISESQQEVGRSRVPLRQKRDFLLKKRWSDDLLPIGRLVKRGAIFRRLSMDGVFQRSVKFDTDYAPTISSRLEDIVANVGDLIATLSCEVDGSPTPKIKWFKDDRELRATSEKHIAKYAGGKVELEMRNLEKSDAGVYLMRATNELGSVECKAKVVVETKKKSKKEDGEPQETVGSPPNFHYKLVDQSVMLGNPAIFTVMSKTTPEPEVEWFRDSLPVDIDNPKYAFKQDKGRYEMEILCCEAADDAVWKVVGKNPFGRCESRCKLTVEIPKDIIAPDFVKSLEDVICQEKQMVKLEAKIAAKPAPEIIWYHGDKELYECARHRLFFDDRQQKYALTIVNAYSEDSGKYRCVAKNIAGSAESACSVLIEELEVPSVRHEVDENKAPHFRMPLANRDVPEGFELTLVCAVTGTPRPAVVWTKDGKSIMDDDCEIKCENGVCTLTLPTTTLKDAGVYTCSAENCHGSAKSSSIVQIEPFESSNVKPAFKEQLMDVAAIEGSEIVLECRVIGTPAPILTWYKDGLRLLLENRMLQYTDRKGVSRLNIMNVVPEDAGEYSCEAINPSGKDFTHCIVKIVGTDESRRSPTKSVTHRRSPSVTLVQEELRPPVITRPLNDATVFEGNRELLEAEVDGNPKPFVEWYLNGKLVVENRTLRTYFDGRIAFLKIYEAYEEHQGQYLCRASNKLGTVETRCTVIVQPQLGAEDRVPNMPKFVRKLENVKVKNVGDSVTLTCQVHGDPRPDVQWLFNGRAIHQDKSNRARAFDDNVCALEIFEVTPETAGTYTAVAHNIYGDAHSSAEVSLATRESIVSTTAAPHFVVEPNAEVTVERNCVLCIVCDISGQPEPQVKWLKNGKEITEPHATIKKDGISHQMIIANVTAEDEGVYKVIAENEEGVAEKNVNVRVTDKRKEVAAKPLKKKISSPSAPSEEPICTQIGANTLTLRWGEPADDGGASIDEYKIEQRRPDEREWTEVGVSPTTEYSVRNLQPNTEYLYRVAARNKVDCGAYSTMSSPVKTLAAGSKPLFKTSFEPVMFVDESEAFEIHSVYEGRPEPNVKWYHNGAEIVEANNVAVTFGEGGGDSALVVSNCKAGVHDGIYSCHIENEAGHAVEEIAVKISPKKKVVEAVEEVTVIKKEAAGAPEVLKHLVNESTLAGQQFVIACRVAANPKGRAAWFKDDERIVGCGRFEIQTQDAGIYRLVCHNANASDSGTYRCVVSNAIGIVQSSCEVSVLDRTLQSAPVFEEPLKDQTALSGANVVLKCRVVGNPEPQAIWMKDGERLSTSRRVKLSFAENGWCSLTVANCDSADTGLYLCSAHNSLGVECTQAMLTVVYPAGPDAHLVTAEEKEKQYRKPYFTRAPAPVVETLEGSVVRLVSRAVGEPAPNVVWKKDGKEISKTSRNYEIRLTGEGESVLTIECVVAKSAGIFTCVAQNSEGSESVETQLIVHTHLHKQPQGEAPSFTVDLLDKGVAIGHPVVLKCEVRGIPEPQLKWFFIDDSRKMTQLKTTAGSAWIECRRGEVSELKADTIVSTQQGTYQCVAVNEHGKAISQCYLLVGEPTDEPAGPPRFLRCLRDIWSPLGKDVTFEVEVGGCPLPELTWFHFDEKVVEDKIVQISYTSQTRCELKISNIGLRHLGTYSVEASNVHGVLRTTAALNVGQRQEDSVPPVFLQDFEERAITIEMPRRRTMEDTGLMLTKMGTAESQRHRLKVEDKRKGAAPKFVQGLHDLELREGDSAALAGKLAQKRHHRIHGRLFDAKGLKESIKLAEGIDEQAPETSKHSVEVTTLEEIRAAIASRNKRLCRPKFMVKPKAKKSIEEFKSLRLKTAISANPTPIVHWDKSGVILETGNKYSIYNDGDFYYLEVHHVSKFDEGFYNCTASNDEGIATCTSEVDVAPAAEGRRRSRKVPKVPTFIEVLPGRIKGVLGEALSVECSVSANPAPSIRWYRNGAVLIPQHDRYTMLYDGESSTLKFACLTVADAGKYTCVAENQLGETKTSMQLDVDLSAATTPIEGCPPVFRVEKIKHAVKATDGDQIVLLAEIVEGSEPITIMWLRNKVEIADSDGFKYARDGRNVSLTIADAFPEDAGDYVCLARNSFGAAECAMRVSITRCQEKSIYETSPVIAEAPKRITVDPGHEAVISATVRGFPEPAIAWSKDNESIVSGDKCQLSHSGEVTTLTIRDASREDAGKYVLKAVNCAGTATATISLEVVEITDSDSALPAFTMLPMSIQCAIGQKAVLKCAFRGSPHPSVSWFRGEQKLTPGRGGIQITSTSTTSELSILRLSEVHIGEYLCAVRNAYGEDLARARILLEGSSAALPQRRSIEH
uniref:Titin n=1 Tax=Parascaris univalens TaxID=6257 RepID=A0A914ZQD0_PARUN